eukprot:CAMPEP_0114162910 /NCGR_PEP_ID=MMETSP0043_2-20121206/29789_1 /TAXON_ID=464988 /ORGANISM="Hemiselmis andersenii, Strain CCMP644" /LENGTH=36 /DNA_ID= /DNA_START= /DNA_END= /DNA_ORIENTATION=
MASPEGGEAAQTPPEGGRGTVKEKETEPDVPERVAV